MLTERKYQLHQISSRLDLFTDRKYRLYRHLILWAAYWSIFIISYKNPNSIEPYATYLKIGISFTLFFQAYVNMYWLVPAYLFKNRFRGYLVRLLLMLGVFSLLLGYAVNLMQDLALRYAQLQLFDPKPALYFAFALVFVGASSAIKLFQRWILDTREIAELTDVSIRSELEQLKNQVNPHFLFNMLNNANVLIESEPKKASQVLMSLSDLLRYQLYDSARSEVLLSADIHFLNDCLALEKIRRDHFDFSVKSTGPVQGQLVPPFLFITFVENAIKHSLDAAHTSFVGVEFHLVDRQLIFTCVNSKPPFEHTKTTFGGLGLANIKRRLELLFGDHHKLAISETADRYTVNLTLNL
ncbi:MAG: histidine kinase [Sphingobacteriales bacterium]|nr:MAG: histidine kinase [Sphingobacteriales bacterium]